MDIWGILETVVRTAEHKLAVVDGEARTYGQVGDRAARLAAYLREQGVGKNACVSVLDDNTGCFFEAYYAAASLGAILNPLNTRLSAGELTCIVADAGSRWILANPRLAQTVRRVVTDSKCLQGTLWVGEGSEEPAASGDSYADIVSVAAASSPVFVEETDVAHLYYTSGSTGKPKGVPLTHRNVVTHARAAIEEFSSLPAEEQLEYKSKTGRPFSHVDLKVVDDRGDEVRPNEEDVGEILVRGPTVFSGYWKRPSGLPTPDGARPCTPPWWSGPERARRRSSSARSARSASRGSRRRSGSTSCPLSRGRARGRSTRKPCGTPSGPTATARSPVKRPIPAGTGPACSRRLSRPRLRRRC